MSESPSSDNRQRHSGGGGRNRRPQPRGNRDDAPRTEHETYRREGGTTDYTPPRERPERDRPKTFGGGEYERVYRDKPEPKVSLGKRFLKIISFGLIGGEPKPATKPAAPNQHRERSGDRPRGERGNDRRGDRNDRSGDRGGRRPDGPRAERAERPERERAPRPASPPREPREPREPRPPQALDLDSITSPRLHVGNLSYDTVESDLFELFNGVAKVTNAEVVTHSRTQRSKGFGFVSLTNLEDAKRAATELHGKPFMGRNITVGSAKGLKPDGPRRDREDRPEPDGYQSDDDSAASEP